MSQLLRNSLVVVVLSVGLSCLFAGCNSSRVTHFDHREFKPLFEVEFPDTAWLAVDSCSTGIHAIVALELDAGPKIQQGGNRLSLRPSDALATTLTHGDKAPVNATYGRLEGPVCLPVSELYGARQIPVLVDPTTACIYVYHAEFELASVPKKNQDLVLHYGAQKVTLALRK